LLKVGILPTFLFIVSSFLDLNKSFSFGLELVKFLNLSNKLILENYIKIIPYNRKENIYNKK